MTYRWLTLALALAGGACERTRLVPATVDEDRSLPAAEWNGSRFHLVREGTDHGPPVIYLAGGPGDDFDYMTRLDTTCEGMWLGDSLPLVFWDQRGSGLSRRHDPSVLRLETFRADLDGLVDLVDPDGEGVVLIGHSWGGTFAADFTDRHPERVRGLVLLEPGELSQALEEENDSPSALDAFSEVVNDFAFGQEVFTLDGHEEIDFYLLLATRRVQTYRVNHEPLPYLRLGGAVVMANFDGDFYPRDYDFTTHLDAFSTEVLVIAGDTPTSDLGAEFQRRQIGVFPRATLEVFEGRGHNDVAWADGCRSAGVIEDYLARVGVLP